MAPSKTHEFLIVGGGTAGITVAARLARAVPSADIAVIEPSTRHYYQPLWTLVGAGLYPKEVTARDEAAVIPPGGFKHNWSRCAPTPARRCSKTWRRAAPRW